LAIKHTHSEITGLGRLMIVGVERSAGDRCNSLLHSLDRSLGTQRGVVIAADPNLAVYTCISSFVLYFIADWRDVMTVSPMTQSAAG